MLVLAHRGANRLEPENTVPAMVTALARGADGVELDVHRTSDGALVVRHDAETPAGLLGELTREAVRAVLPDAPTLDEVLDVCSGTLVNVEVKDGDPRAVDALVALLAGRANASSDRVLVSSFDWDAMDRVRQVAPDVRTGLLSFGMSPFEVLTAAAGRGHHAVHPDVWAVDSVDVVELVARAHEQEVQVNVWTVNDPGHVEELEAAGVDAVITDDVALYRFGVRGRRR